ncbi:MAG: T9SS type A sorting domain-containing protein [Bacteroidota bacterium]
MRLHCVVLFIFLLTAANGVFGQTANTNYWQTDGTVSTILRDAQTNSIYIGGNFQYVGPYTGSVIKVDSVNGDRSLTFPQCNGVVYAVISDGSGGYYVGGEFTQIGGVNRTNIAHIKADHSIDAGFSVAFGSLLPWNPTFGSAIWKLAYVNDTIFAIGNFSTVNSTNRSRIAAVDTSGSLVSTWAPTLYNSGNAIAANSIVISGDVVYIGGEFTSVNGQSRQNLAAVSRSDGSLLSWTANVTGSVYSLSQIGPRLCVGGSFTQINDSIRTNLALVDTSTGQPTALNLHPNANIYASTITGSRLIVGGSFTKIGDDFRFYTAMVDTGTGMVLPWNPGATDYVRSVIVDGALIVYGGFFKIANGEIRRGVAKFDEASGTLIDWDAHLKVTDESIGSAPDIQSLFLLENRLYIGGTFDSVNATAQAYAAAVDTGTAALSAWNPQPNNDVTNILGAGESIYMTGSFTSVNGTARTEFASVTATTGALQSLTINANGGINDLMIVDSTLFVGGYFTSIGDSSRNKLAAIDTATGKATSWNPVPNGNVNDIDTTSSQIIIAGGFSTIDAASRNYLASFNRSTKNLSIWNPNADGDVLCIGTSPNGVVYAGGYFTTIGGASRSGAAAIDADGITTTWDPQLTNADLQSILFSSATEQVYLGGNFDYVGTIEYGNFTVVSDPYNVALPVELVSFTAVLQRNKIELLWKTATEADNYGFEIERRSINHGNSNNDDWKNVGFVKGNGTSNAPNEYSFTDTNVPSGRFAYRLKQVDRDGTFAYSQEVESGSALMPSRPTLHQNFPNPFNPSTSIQYDLPVRSHITVRIYDSIGRLVSELESGVKEAGRYSTTFNGSQLASGIYFIRMRAGNEMQIKKMQLIK